MRRGRRKAPDIDPYLSTSDFLEMSRVSPMTLRTYEANGLIEPAYRSEADGYKYWTIDQIPLIELIDAMRSGGAPIAGIGQAQMCGKEPFLDSVYNAQAAKLRRDRRMMKSIVHSRRRFSDLRRIAAGGGFYLRYLPVRWMAIAPLVPHEAEFANNRRFMREFGDLLKVASAAGWCDTMTFGVLLSISADGSRASRYSYVELASPPMPETTGSMVVDGGCYRVFDKSFNEGVCDGKHCEACARFGCVPDPKDVSRWNEKAAELPGLFDHVLRFEDVEEPIAAGDSWSSFKLAALAKQRGASMEGIFHESVGYGKRGKASSKRSCAVPCRMPLGVRLPMGVTACELPAGVYLCKQIAFEDAEAKREFLNLAKSLPASGRTPDEVFLSLGEATSQWNEPDSKGPFVEPFAVPRTHGVPSLEGFSQALTDDQVRSLSLVEPAGLELEDGFCVTSSNMVMSYDQSVTQEYHVLVDPEGFLPNL